MHQACARRGASVLFILEEDELVIGITGAKEEPHVLMEGVVRIRGRDLDLGRGGSAWGERKMDRSASGAQVHGTLPHAA